MSVDLKILEETAERAVKRALTETRGEDLKILAEAIKVMADYIREGFKIFDHRFKQIDRRFKAIDNRLEQIDKRLLTLENNVRYLIGAVNELKSAVGATLEDYTSVWLSRWLKERGFKCEIKTRATVFTDRPREVDILCLEPLVIGEATTTIRTIEEAENEIRKLLENVNAIEKIHGIKHYAKLIAVEAAPEKVAEHLKKRAEELGIVLILGRKY